MHGWAHSRRRIGGVEEADQLREDTVPGEIFGPQILPAGKQEKADESDRLGHEDVALEPAEQGPVLQQEQDQRSRDQQIPADIGDHEPFAEGHQIIQWAMDGITHFCRDQILGQQIQSKIADPSQKQEQMAVLGSAQIIQS